MRHARAGLAIGSVALLAAVAACSQMADASSFGDGNKRSPTAGECDEATGQPCQDSNKNGSDAGEFTGGPATAPGAPTSDGVLIVHAAKFSSLRLCFENAMDLPPQPDSTVMPQANVVGVEVGSLVRIDPLRSAPGKVYIVRERDVRTIPGDTKDKCSDYIKRNGSGADVGKLQEGSGYVVSTTTIDRPIGVNQAEVLAITGCGSKLMLAAFDGVALSSVDPTACDDGWNADTGNAAAHVVPLASTFETPSDQSIPIQLYNMAPAIKALDGSVKVTFGETGKPGEELPLGPLLDQGVPTTLTVEQTEPASFGKNGFTLTAKIPGKVDVSAAQTLADVQRLSAPSENPTTYYRSASNYALLVLGDPTYATKTDDPEYNPRRALHILAVPVLDPSKADAGAGADAGTTDGGVP